MAKQMNLQKILGSNITNIIILVIISTLVFIAGYSLSSCNSAAAYNKLLSLTESQHEQVTVSSNKVRSLEGAISEMQDENTHLLSLLKEMKDKPTEIRYITQTETVLIASDPLVILPELPQEYLYKVQDEVVVARFAKQNEQYVFNTYDLSFKNTILTGEKSTAALLQVSSSYNPELLVEVPVELEVVKINQVKLFEPHISLGITGSIPKPAVTASILLGFIHPREELDVGIIRLSANTENLKLGIEPVSYNLGHITPVITDTWISAGPSIDITGSFSADLTISTKF